MNDLSKSCGHFLPGDVVVIGMMGLARDEVGLILGIGDTYMDRTIYSILIGCEIFNVYDTEIYPLDAA